MMQERPTTFVQIIVKNKERLKYANNTLEKGSTYFIKQFNSDDAIIDQLPHFWRRPPLPGLTPSFLKPGSGGLLQKCGILSITPPLTSSYLLNFDITSVDLVRKKSPHFRGFDLN